MSHQIKKKRQRAALHSEAATANFVFAMLPRGNISTYPKAAADI